jgi:integrase
MHHPDPPRLLARVRERMRFKHYSIRTEQAYVDWIRRFIRFHDKRHPSELGAVDVEAFLTSLAVERNVAASTQNQAKSAILFLYREILGVELPWLDGIQSARRPARLPVVLTPGEVRSVLGQLRGKHALIGRLLCGTGMRILEVLRLRVGDVDFDRRQIVVRDGKGARDRMTVLPSGVAGQLSVHLVEVAEVHRADLAAGEALLPFALARKYPDAGRKPCGTRASPRPRPRTRSAIRSPRTCSMPATIFALSRNCWATRTSARR